MVWPVSHLRFVLATVVSEAKVTFERLALEGTNQIRPNAVGPVGSLAAHFAFGGQGRRRDHLQGDRNLGEDHPANVRGDAKGREIFMRLCQAW